jgi:carbonic anhydrase
MPSISLNTKILGPLCAAALLVSACAPVMREAAEARPAPTVPQGTPEAPGGSAHGEAHNTGHWSYAGDTGPDFWGELSPEYAECATGTQQSPIDVDTVKEENLVNLAFNYNLSRVNILNNGHTVEVVYDPGSFFTLDGEQYDLKQFHFHAPSEHTVDGQFAAIELHLVHQTADGKKAVVAVLINEGAENPAFVPVWRHLPAQEVAETTYDIEVNAADLLPSDQTTFRYAGSLTTPPCSEGVSWFLMIRPIEMSAEQIAAFTAIYDGNHRPVQPVNGRTILADTTP